MAALHVSPMRDESSKTTEYINQHGEKITTVPVRAMGERGVYGCVDYRYKQNGNSFSCGARYYFGADFSSLLKIEKEGQTDVGICDDCWSFACECEV